jgi:hypothetical protein
MFMISTTGVNVTRHFVFAADGRVKKATAFVAGEFSSYKPNI